MEAFETAEFQLKLFSSFSDDLQDQLLFSTLAEAKEGDDMIKDILAAWRAGDPAAMEGVITQEVRRYPSLQSVNGKLVYERNNTMTRKIEELLKTGKTYFVAVGAGHLVSQRGIVNQLRESNYTVQQL